MESTTSRRELLKATPTAAALIALPCASSSEAAEPVTEDGRYAREEYEAGRKSAEEIAYLWVACAWMDRWKALGGDVGLSFRPDGRVAGVHRGMTCMTELWAPEAPDREREDLPPHTWLIEERHHDGAVKALEGLLELVPGLRAAVREIAGREAFQRFAETQEA